MTEWIQAMLHSRAMPVSVGRGYPQGGVLSPML